MFKRFFLFFVYFLFSCKAIFAANVGLLIMATGKYISFVDPLIKSAEECFCPNHKVTFYVFTDGKLKSADNVVCLYQARLGWPFDTMMRYHAYLAYQNEWAKEDYIFACDADMRFVGLVGEEILGDRVATIHPGYYKSERSSYTFETNSQSKAYIAPDEGNYYFAGGFYGASSKEFLKLLETNVKNINNDLERGLIAVWHDESHWNRYCIDHPPTVILDPSYCYPESWVIPFPKRLIALDKNHSEMRL